MQVTSLKMQVTSLKMQVTSLRNAVLRATCLSGLFVLLGLFTSGCATEKIAEGLTSKNTSGNGTVIESHIGINTETKVPELKTLFVSGDIATVKAGTNAVSYREESSASVWNASSVTKKRFLAITLSDDGDVPETIKAVAEVFKTAESPAAAKPAAETGSGKSGSSAAK